MTHKQTLKGDVAGLFIFTNETTSRVLAQQQLHALNASLELQVAERTEALRLFANIVQSDTAPICAFDTDFRLIAFNQAHSDEFFRIYAYRVQVGDVFPEHFVPEQRDVIRGFMSRALSGESFTITEEFGDPNLLVPHWEVTYNPLRGEDGRIIGAFHHARDITDRLRAEAKLVTTQEALRQSQKMEAVGQLTGGLAHDFNNLLTAVTGGLELLQHRITQGRFDELDRYVAMAKTGADRAAALTQRLLAFSRRQTLAPKSTDVDRLVAGMQDIISRSIGPAIEVIVSGAAGLWPVLIDAPQLENALLNLCINARDAMPDGGTITIQTSNTSLSARSAAVQDLPEGEYVALCVTDTGTGMSPDVIERVFDPFFTTKPIGSGTGLGLSMIYGFVRQSGGQVRINSEVGTGTTMCIYLPRHSVTAETSDPAEAASDGWRTDTGQTVLLVEDEVDIRDLVGEVLGDAGYHVLFASSGPAGVKVLQSKAHIDLLITDVGLPGGLNGRQVADAGRVVRPDLKVLFVTGYAANAAVGAGHMDEGMEVLVKPFNILDLERRVHDLLTVGSIR